MRAVIYHNPACGTSRNVRAFLDACDIEVTVIDYLAEGWTRPQLLALFAAADLTPRTALRTTKSPAQELGLLDETVPDVAILSHMLDHPVLVNRPIVCTPRGVRLCRPSERVLDMVDAEFWPQGPFFKEDGAMLLTETGARA